MVRAQVIEELKTLLTMVKIGNVKGVQEWVAQGKPIGLPENGYSKGWRSIPLRVAIEKGSFSVVEALLKGSPPLREGNFDPLELAVRMRRHDLAGLLLDHGASVNDVDMREVFEEWNEEMVKLFISRGASLVEDRPVAWSLIKKMRPALGLVKKYGEGIPDVMAQADIALRYHAEKGDPKWVDLLIWAGADPLSRGPDSVRERWEEDEEEVPEDGYHNAVELAVKAGNKEVFKNKKMLSALDMSETKALLDMIAQFAFNLEGKFYNSSEVLSLLFHHGHTPVKIDDHGTRVINSLLRSMTWGEMSHGLSSYFDNKKNIHSDYSMDRLKMIHMLMAKGAKWLPKEREEIKEVRGNLLKMRAGYTLEFVWLMKEYQAAQRRDVLELVKASSMTGLLGKEKEKALKLAADVPEQISDEVDQYQNNDGKA